ncbi:MAG: hypothetical protein AUH85_15095 [Chloroflexi bacterium 13_1_40CM_4_68_4]|nr:MAG: hypothetical protein AUH85_15095 [Chloroflexi bacterium 13_1_40CM_4_68_4]
MGAQRQLYSTRSKWEFQFGYSRAVRQGNVIRVAGTAGLDDTGTPVKGGAEAQTRRALEIIEVALQELGAEFKDVIMARIYVRDTASMMDVAVLVGQRFRDIRPATTILQAGFVDPQILVEIEIEALVSEAT